MNSKKRKREEKEEVLAEIQGSYVFNKRFVTVLDFLFSSKKSSLMRVFEKPERKSDYFYAKTERIQCSLDAWIKRNPPLYMGELNVHGFIRPMKSLLKHILAMRDVFEGRDFRVPMDSVHAIRSRKGRYKLIVLEAEVATDEQPVICHRAFDLACIIRRWFQLSGQGMTDPEVLSFVHCLETIRQFEQESNALTMMKMHPIFYYGRKKKILLDFLVKADHLVSINRFRVISVTYLLDGFLTSGRTIEEDMDWFDIGSRNALQSYTITRGQYRKNPMTKFLRKATAPLAFQTMSQFIRVLRNAVVHIHEKEDGDKISRNECAIILNNIMPGMFSAIFYVLLRCSCAGDFTTTKSVYP